MRVHQEYIKEEKPQWVNRTDYFEESTIARIIIGDVLSNDGVVKLLRKLYALPKNKFKVKNYYKKGLSYILRTNLFRLLLSDQTFSLTTAM